VAFDLDGTILDDIGLIGDLAGDVLHRAFGTPPEEGRLHYLATTGMPFEAQLVQLYPTAPAELREQTARIFHQRKVVEAYGGARPFAEIPKLLKRLSTEGWTLVISTGSEREMADLVLEREGLRFWFEEVVGSGQGTKREHLAAFRRRFPELPTFMVGDSRFDMEAGRDTPGVIAIGRATSLLGWTLTPDDLKRWGAAWADYSLAELPEVLDRLRRRASRSASPMAREKR
jgi:phosphoglycolate phosphatase-like HAD superfamily hydrolase